MENKKTKKLTTATVGGENGSAGSDRDPHGIALKVNTKDGNWDLVGNKTPVFFVKDSKRFDYFIHTQKRDSRTKLKIANMIGESRGFNPERLHQVLILMSDRGTPASYRHMHGFGSPSFSMINAGYERVWIKFHFKTQQGIQHFIGSGADYMKSKYMDQAQRSLVHSIDNSDFPRWTLYIQVMNGQETGKQECNPSDLTKIWPHSFFPLIEAGVMELYENPSNYLAETGQSAFAPTQVLDNISQGRVADGSGENWKPSWKKWTGTNQ